MTTLHSNNNNNDVVITVLHKHKQNGQMEQMIHDK